MEYQTPLDVYGEPICNPYYTFYNECRINICRGGYGGTGPTVSILHFNSQIGDYEIPSDYYAGETYILNGFMLNDNFCKKTDKIEEEYQKYKENPTNFTSTKYVDLKFSFIVQISKLDRGKSTVIYLDNFSNIVKPGEEKMHSFQWLPKEKGQYIIERFIVYDIKNPIPLAPKHVTYVDVQDANGQQDLLTFLIPGFDNSIPPTSDKTFKIEYSDIVQSINTTSDETLDFWGFEIELKQNSEEIFDIKIPKNFPTPASFTNSWNYYERPIVILGTQETNYEMVEDPCYFHYKIPVEDKTHVEIAYAVILAGTHQLYSPIQFDENDPCYNKVFYEPSLESPLKQFKEGIHFEDIRCKQDLFLIQKIDGTPVCVSYETKEKLIVRGWAKGESSFAGEILEELRKGPQEVSIEQTQFILNQVVLNGEVSEFLKGRNWDYTCCIYLINEESVPAKYSITINFFDRDNKKQLLAVFDLNTFSVTDISIGNMTQHHPLPLGN